MTNVATVRRSAIWVAVGALLISFSPVFVKHVVPDRMGPTAVGFYRTLFGGLALALFTKARGGSLRLPKNLIGLAVLAGLVFALDLGSWHRSIPLIGAGLSTLLANTQVVWVALVGAFLLHEGGGWSLTLSVAMSVVGVALIAGVVTPEGVPPINAWGVVLGLSTGLYYAGFILTLRRAQSRPQAPTAIVFMAWASLCTAAFLAVGTWLFDESFAIPDTTSLLCLLALALVVQAAAWTILTKHMPRIRAALGALLLLLQPTFATIWGVLIFRESLTIYQVVGAALILVAIYLGSTARGVTESA